MHKAVKIIASVFLVEVIAVTAYLGVRDQNSLKQMKTAFSAGALWAQERAYLGSADARFKIIEFGDYQCPPCRATSDQIQAWMKKEPNLFQFQFRNFPLAMHPYAESAATWVEGLDRRSFWMAHNDLYKNQRALSDDLLAVLSVKYRSSTSSQGRSSVEADLTLSKQLGLFATPTIFVIGPDQAAYRCASLDQARFVISTVK